MRARIVLALAVAAAGPLVLQQRAAALDRCAGADPFTPALKADVTNRFAGHHVTATAHDTRSGARGT